MEMTLFRNANVVTMDDVRPRATSVAVQGGRILTVGQTDGLRSARVVDLDGATVVPGFNDAHNHMVHFGTTLTELALSSPPMRSVEQIVEVVAAEARSTPTGSWIIGSRYDQNKLEGGRHPTAQELDRVAPDHFVWLKHTSGHMAVVNSRVLDTVDIDAVPEGGVAVRDDEGRPTGLLQEQAQLLVRRLVHPLSQDALVDAIEQAGRHYLTEGITSCQEAGIGGGWVGHSPLELGAYQRARAEGRLPVRVSVMVAAEGLHDLEHHEQDEGFGLDLGLRTGLGDEWLRVGPVKVFADGSLLGLTAAMHDDFASEPGNRGYLQMAEEKLRTVITRAHRAGWQVATHAIGDRAVATVLDIYGEALRAAPRDDHRHRIEHCGVADDEQVARLARLGVIAVPQGRFVSEIGDGMMAALGPQRTRWCYRQRSFLDAGVVLPGSSDRPVVAGAPLLGIHDLVNQRTASGRAFNPDEALTAEQALRCFTLGSAYASFDEHRKGSLEAGKLADMTVLSDDPTRVEPGRIRDIEVLATVVGGEVVHDAAVSRDALT